MTGDYIPRKAAIKAVSENDCEGYATWAVKAIHAADVRPVVRGKWTEKMVVGGFAESWKSTGKVLGERETSPIGCRYQSRQRRVEHECFSSL